MVEKALKFWREAIPVQPFDPEGSGYDAVSAPLGMEGDALIEPRSGLILVGRKHPKWEEAVQQAREGGNVIIRSAGGRYFAFRFPDYVRQSIPGEQLEESQAQKEYALEDYHYAQMKGLPVGFVRQIWREATTNLPKHIPFVGRLLSAWDESQARKAYDRLQNWDYNKPIITALQQGFYPGIHSLPPSDVYASREKDIQTLSVFLERMLEDKTFGAKVSEGVTDLASFVVEWAILGGPAKAAFSAAKTGLNRLLGRYAATAAGKLAVRTAALSAEITARSAGMFTHAIEEYQRRMREMDFGLRNRESPAKVMTDAYLNTVISVVSEMPGQAITQGTLAALKRLPFSSKLIAEIEREWIQMTGGTAAEFAKRTLSRAGYSNLLGEFTEERLSTIMQAVLGTEDFGLGPDSTTAERLKAGILEDLKTLWLETVILSVPQAAHLLAISVDSSVPELYKESVEWLEKDFQRKPLIKEMEKEHARQEEKEESKERKQEVRPEETREAESLPPPQQVPPKPSQPIGTTSDTSETVPASLTKETPLPTTSTKPLQRAVQEANYSRDIDDIVRRVLTDGPDIFSVPKEDLKRYREMLGLGDVASPARHSWQQSIQEALNLGLVDKAMDMAQELILSPRTITDVESAALSVRAAKTYFQIRNQYKLYDAASEDIRSGLLADIHRLENEFDLLTQGMLRAKTEVARALNIQKLRLTETYDIVHVVRRAKEAKRGELTPEERAVLEEYIRLLEEKDKQIEELAGQIQALRSERAIREEFMSRKRGILSEYSNMSQSQLTAEILILKADIKEMLDAGC